MATRLFDLKIEHVAGVDKPANKRSFLIIKQEKLPTEAEIKAKAIEYLALNKAAYPWEKCMSDAMKQYGDKETAQKVCGMIRATYGKIQREADMRKQMSIQREGNKYCLYDGNKKIGEYDTMADAQAAKAEEAGETDSNKGASMLTTEQIGKIEDKDIQEAVVAQQEEMLVLQRQLEDAKKSPPNNTANLDDENVWKGIPPALRNRVEALKKERDDMAKKAKEANDQSEISLWVTKCKAFKYLQTTPEHFGKVMKVVAEHCKDEAEEVYRVLTAADGLIDKGHVFSEYGRNGNESKAYDATNIDARVDAMAEDLMKMDHSGKLTYDAAVQKVFKDNPDLHRAWKKSSQIKINAH